MFRKANIISVENGFQVFWLHFYGRCIWLVWLFTPNKWLQIPIKAPLVIYLQYHKDGKTPAVPELLYLVQTKARYVLVKVTLIVAYENIIIGRARKKNRIARLPARMEVSICRTVLGTYTQCWFIENGLIRNTDEILRNFKKRVKKQSQL